MLNCFQLGHLGTRCSSLLLSFSSVLCVYTGCWILSEYAKKLNETLLVLSHVGSEDLCRFACLLEAIAAAGQATQVSWSGVHLGK